MIQISKTEEKFYVKVTSAGHHAIVDGYRIIGKFRPFIIFVHHKVGKKKKWWMVSEATTGCSLTKQKDYYPTRFVAVEAAVRRVRNSKRLSQTMKCAIEQTGSTPWKEEKK